MRVLLCCTAHPISGNHSNVSDIFYLPQDGATPLFIASQNGHSDVVNILIRSGAGVDVPENVSNCKLVWYFFCSEHELLIQCSIHVLFLGWSY